tara:strand:- start:115 stop:321 length:207 start_codon:yes stop_codon:yes gene_type:complete
MLSEFTIASDLIHPNVLKYYYFVRKYFSRTDHYEFHILTELMEGGDLCDFIHKKKKDISLDTIRNFGL